MAKKNDKAFGLLFLIGIVVFLISKIFEFIYDNIVVIGILLALGLTIFAVVKYIEHKELKKQKEQEIQNTILKSIQEKNAKEEHQIEEKVGIVLNETDYKSVNLCTYRQKFREIKDVKYISLRIYRQLIDYQ